MMLESLTGWSQNHPATSQGLFALGILILCVLSFLVTRHAIVRAVARRRRSRRGRRPPLLGSGLQSAS